MNWRNVIEISDLHGTPVEIYGRGSYGWTPPQGDIQLVESEHPLKLNEIFGEANSVKARVIFQKTDANGFTLQEITRDFTLKRPKIVPLASRRRSDFTIEKIEWKTAIENGVPIYKFLFHFAPGDARNGMNPDLTWSGRWVVRAKDGKGATAIYPSTRSGSNPDKTGRTTLELSGSAVEGSANKGDFYNSPDKSASLDLLLGTREGWPQKVHIELPLGLPEEATKTLNLAFTAKFAPLPQ